MEALPPLAGALVVAVLTSCAPAGPGVLAYPDEDAVWCAPADLYPAVALGAPLDFDEGGPIRILGVELDGASGVELGDVYVMPVTETWRLQLSPFPPAQDFPDEWPDAVKITDATVVAGAPQDLVAEIRYVGPGDAAFESMVIVYEQDGQQFRSDTFVGLDFVEGACS